MPSCKGSLNSKRDADASGCNEVQLLHVILYRMVIRQDAKMPIRMQHEAEPARVFHAARREFSNLELLHEGESKIVRKIDECNCITMLKPTLFSFTAQRSNIVSGTDILRLESSRILWRELMKAGVSIPIIYVGDDFYVSRIVDAPPIEVIVKAAHVGTPKHLYSGIENTRTRQGEVFSSCQAHPPYVRFDWRNPLPLKDECMPSPLANYFINTEEAEMTAQKAFATLQGFLKKRRITLLDICFFIDSTGKHVFGEISPDCMRAKFQDSDLDKDLWRKGRSDREILDKWELFVNLISNPTHAEYADRS